MRRRPRSELTKTEGLAPHRPEIVITHCKNLVAVIRYDLNRMAAASTLTVEAQPGPMGPVAAKGKMAVAMNDAPNGWARNGVNGVTSVIAVVLRAIAVALAIFLLALSVPLFFLPIPLGLPLAIIGLLLLAATSKRAHRFITDWLKRHPGVWDRVKHIFDRFHKE